MLIILTISIFSAADDCFELGRQSYNNDDHIHSVLWLQEALIKYKAESHNKTATLPSIFEHLSFSIYKQGAPIMFDIL